ncbi:3-oxoacyl-[acyl-carrier-protein] reductase FabG [Defluviimonas aquaemixtae]|uniref:3-oxoacyl-[acyl-carrier-protein] reductase FabG n=1 Tax=Albidovulum aquaemixtae TaxID=1542388 RepID=A0A2R8BJ66_9RHOB|nr:SDR family oxidoreductase [Defluviimonas aquaemixtae]SPH23414.1 3-oxoacyl-[acyl-carrier-protein] reductase FabG [Defluviimonas aquaemixtae]
MTGRALVTGGARRLGRAMVLYLAGRGFDVAIHFASSERDAKTATEEARALGARAETIQADLLVEAETRELVAHAAEALGGPLSVLVNNASIFEYDNIRSGTRESWDRHIESNLRAPVALTQDFAAQAPQAAENGGELLSRALVVNMLDQRVMKLTPEFMSYTIAKMGLWAFTQTAARALAPNVRVNAIGPGSTLQGLGQTEEQFRAQRAGSILKRGANPEDICAALGYLVDAPAVTGQLICVDGGQHLGWTSPDILGVD